MPDREQHQSASDNAAERSPVAASGASDSAATTPRSHWPACLSLRPEPVYDDGTPNPCDCRTLSRIKLQDNPEMGDRLLAAVDQVPVRLCCFQRHWGVVCPDGKVMCCQCFGRFDVADLFAYPGDEMPSDVCKTCGEADSART